MMGDDNFYDEVVLGSATQNRELVRFDGGGASGAAQTVREGTRDPTQGEVANLIMKFLVMVPEEDRQSHIRMMFHVEQAYWYYIDFMRIEDPSLRNLTIARFAELLFRQLPGFQEYSDSSMVEDIVAQWRAYSAQIPRAGGILLNPSMDKVLLIRGTKSSASWGFPRGKIGARDEAYDACAAREIKEETGFDVSHLIRPDDYLELNIDSVPWRMYIVQGVDEDTAFMPECRGEIGAYMWFFIDELPATHAQNGEGFYDITLQRRLKFFGVWEFVKPLRKWIKSQGKARVADTLRSKARGIVGLPVGHGSAVSHENSTHDAGRAESDRAASSTALHHGHHHNASTSSALSYHPAVDDMTIYPGKSWLEFKLDTSMVMAAFDAAWEEGEANELLYADTAGAAIVDQEVYVSAS